MIRMIFILLLIAPHAQAELEVDPFEENNFVLKYHEPYIDLQVDGVPANKIIKAIAQAAKQNIVMADTFDRNLDLNWEHVHWQEALISLCKQLSCSIERSAQVWVVKKGSLPDDKILRIFPLHYIKAPILLEMIKQGATWLGDKSSVMVDKSSNALVVHAALDAIALLDGLIKDLDKPAQQVLIQARIINASSKFSQELGVAFSAAPYQDEQGVVARLGTNGGFGHFNVGLAKLPLDTQLDVMIAAAQKDHQTRILAMPKILTANEQEAHIKQGKELAYEETSRSGATTLKFKEAVLELRVTPHIALSHEIILDLKVKHDVPGTLGENGQPTIDTQSIQTQVRLQDGETVVLGGIFSRSQAKREDRVPFLHRIPLLGYLFKDHSDLDDQEELLVFVTPHVL